MSGYRARATRGGGWEVGTTGEVGVAVAGGASLGSTRISPGKKKDAGDTLWEALIPPHPASNKPRAGIIAKRNHLQLSLI